MLFLRSARPLGFFLTIALTSSGCFQFSSVLTVKGDGTGTIQQRLLLTSAGLAQLQAFGLMGRRGNNFDPVSEEQVRAAAGGLGEGVTYVSSTPIDTSEGRGRDIVYAFTDINQLRLAEAPPGAGGVNIRGQGLTDGQQISFNLTRPPGGNAVLRINIPRPSMPGSGGGEFSSGQIAMFKQMVAGARLAIVVNPVGTLVRASSPYVDGQRVTLIDLNVDELLRDDTLLSRLQAAKTQDEAKQILAGVPGVKVNLDPEITIEFTPSP
jgi:hypothetical protein